jgi:hypothetical protein
VPIRRTRRFNKAFLQLPAHIQAKALKALRLLDADFRHPGLRAKRVKGTRDIYEARVDFGYRMTHQRQGDWLIVSSIGAHDDALDKP